MVRTNTLTDIAGHFGWQVEKSDWGYGTFLLSLSFPGTEGEWSGTLVRVPQSGLFLVR